MQNNELMLKIFDKVSHKVGFKWKSFGIRLGLLNTDVEYIEYDSKCLYDKVFAVLTKWKEISGDPTWEQLKKHLSDFGRNDIVADVEREFTNQIISNKEQSVSKVSPPTIVDLKDLENDVTTLKNETREIGERLETIECETKKIQEHLAQIDSDLRQKLNDYDVVLIDYLESSNLSEANKKKITEYYNAFVGTILSAYTAAQAVNSDWVETKKSLAVSFLSNAISTVPAAGVTLAKFVESIDVPFSAAISGIASLIGKGVGAGGNFTVNMSIKQAAIKLEKLASCPIIMNKQVSQEVLEIVKNEHKRKQILDVTAEDLKKLPDSLFKKIKLYLYECPKEKIDQFLYGKMYSTPAEMLGNKDAHALLKKYFKFSNDVDNKIAFKEAAQDVMQDCELSTFFDLKAVQEEVTKIVEEAVISDIADCITKLCERAAKGEWVKHKWYFVQKSCSELFEKGYLQSKLKSPYQSVIPDEKIKVVQIVMFKYMCSAIVNSGKENMACVAGFAKEYPELLKVIVEQNPEYFINEQVVKAAIPTDCDLQNKVLSKLNKTIRGQGTGGI